jgi:6-phosphogluconate dehydrogenase
MGDAVLGMVGLGTIGRNLLLNMADHGFPVAGYDKDLTKVEQLRTETESRPIQAAATAKELADKLRVPRTVMILVPAGRPVDAVIHDMLPFLSPGDMLIDGGNSYYRDTDLRAKALSERGILYLGVGISGGEYGARHGPSLMPGGPKEGYERVRAVFEAVAAQVNGEPSVAYMGPVSAGHYVKMVHNGIEYGILQSIADTYALLKEGLGLEDGELSAVYSQWNRGKLSAYLLEITAEIFLVRDEKTHKLLVNIILDEAKQLGTGKWTSQDAMDLQIPTPTIDISVAMRNMSALKDQREAGSRILKGPSPQFRGERQPFVDQLENALYVAMVECFAQGMAVLRAASDAYAYQLNLETIARIWRGGCIIRAAMLEGIRSAFRAQPELPNLVLDKEIAQALASAQADLRPIVRSASEWGIPAPAMMASLAYYDSYRSAWLPANLIQAQRDYFGAHTYERIDEKGIFHTEWETD